MEDRNLREQIAWLIVERLEVPGEGPCKGCYHTADKILKAMREPNQDMRMGMLDAFVSKKIELDGAEATKTLVVSSMETDVVWHAGIDYILSLPGEPTP